MIRARAGWGVLAAGWTCLPSGGVGSGQGWILVVCGRLGWWVGAGDSFLGGIFHVFWGCRGGAHAVVIARHVVYAFVGRGSYG